ncbi:WG repeat protein [Chitinophaga polysaccharea]|uniref:WG repeat protein n=1 Tax=Chitinophaga polysaccharea TaxID=1293035 RepID=A0A561PXD1_9BACT|nr:WG repeat-containing protein [Chitinophaga polysaccharea]TWF42774.1 WG repeat protein [Chitinophaga polysaccharea]
MLRNSIVRFLVLFLPLGARAQEPVLAFVSDQQYSNIANFSGGLARVRTDANQLYGFIDTTGKVTIPLQFDEAESFHDGLAIVGKTTNDTILYGYINRAGQLQVPYQFDEAKDFSGNRAAVRKNDTWYYIDPSGKVTLGQEFVRMDTVIDQANNGAFDRVVADPRSFHDGRLLVRKDSLFGYADTSGVWVIPPIYLAARDFSDGVALVATAAPPGDSMKGNDELSTLYNSLPQGAPDLNWSVIDLSGKVVFSIDAEEIGDYTDGLAPFYKNGAWGLMNKTGRPVFMPQFHEKPYRFSGGLSAVQVNGTARDNSDGHLYILDTTGAIRAKVPLCDNSGSCIYDSHVMFSDGLIAVKRGGVISGWGFMDATGKMVIAPQYEDVTPFSEGRAVVVDREGALLVIKKPDTK